MLLAPNGKPSNLTPEQYNLVRTPAFKAWFGDWEKLANAKIKDGGIDESTLELLSRDVSKVVDENGEPMVVWHGTYVENPFYTFDFKKADIGFHFGTYEQAKNRSETKLFFKEYKSIINPFFLNIRKLFETTDIGEWEYPQRYIDMLVSDNLISETDAKKYGFFRLYEKSDNKAIREYLLKKYKTQIGFEYDNQHEGEGKSYIVFEPTQIKLADGTNTNFDSSNPDIRFEDGGDLKINDMKSEITVSHIDRKYPNLSHNFINKQLMMGIEIEMEHTDNPEVAKKIALDHLNESPYYYQELEKMEARLQRKKFDSHFEDIKRVYGDGGTIDEIFSFKTPSGEKSRLTYIQQVLVRTSAFKNFFGDWELAGKRYIKDGKENFQKHYKDVSKVIDWVTLEPRVVYHGTRAEQEFFNFDVTREKGVGRPYAYFAHNIEYAENFTRVSQRQDLDAKPFLYNCFLNVRNPFMAIGQEFVDKSRDSEGWLRAIVGNIVWDKYRTINRDDFTKAVESTVQSQIGNYIENVYGDRKDKFWKLMARDINKEFKFFLLAYDYDGVFYSEEFSAEYDIDNPSQFTFAITIFDSRQVKLADGRNTKFDPLNSDIRYADGGATDNTTQNENDMNKLEQLNSIMKGGGAIYKEGGETEHLNKEEQTTPNKLEKLGEFLKNGGSVKGDGKHSSDAKKGGYFEGNSHANGGIKAINKDTGQIIEVEGNEVIINKRSVADSTKREFEGEMLTNREILSRINESGGGVKFEDGGEMEHSTCGCSGKKYNYGGETLEDYVILHRMSISTSPKEDSQHLIKEVYG